MGQMEGFHGTFGALFTYKLADGTTGVAAGTFSIDSDGPGYRIPEEATLSLHSQAARLDLVVHRLRSAGDPRRVRRGHQPAGRRVRHQPRPGDRLVPGYSPRSVRVDGPGLERRAHCVAVGVGSLCPDKGQLAWNHSGLPNPAAAYVDIDVDVSASKKDSRSRSTRGPGRPQHANIVDVEGTIDGLPSQMDVILSGTPSSFTRSTDVAPDVYLRGSRWPTTTPPTPTTFRCSPRRTDNTYRGTSW